MLVTSRPEREISDVLGRRQQLEVSDVFVNQDIAVYADWRLSHDVNLRGIKHGLKDDIADTITAKAKGKYLSTPLSNR